MVWGGLGLSVAARGYFRDTGEDSVYMTKDRSWMGEWTGGLMSHPPSNEIITLNENAQDFQVQAIEVTEEVHRCEHRVWRGDSDLSVAARVYQMLF